MEPKWLSASIVEAIHLEAIARFGGTDGIRDEGLLESALQRAKNLYFYGDEASVYAMAAAYCAGIVKNHPFLDGNKRTGLLAANVFLDLNDYAFQPNEAEAVNVIIALAAGEIDEAALAEWISDNTMRRR